MINRTRLSLSVLFVIGLAGTAFGQHSKLSGYVYDGNNVPRPSVTIVIVGAGTAVTDGDGHFSAILPDAQFKPGQPVTIRVNRWRVFDPIFGQCQTQEISFKEIKFRVTIVPPRSVAAHLNRERLGAIVEAYEKSVNNLTGKLANIQKVLTQKSGEAVALKDEMGDLKQEREKYGFLKKYSEEYEIPIDEIKTALDDWAHSKQAVNEQEQARQAYWNGDLAQVLKLTDNIEEDARFARQEREKGLKTNGSRIEKFRLRGNIFMNGKRYMEALAVFRQLEQLFEEKIFSREDFSQDWTYVNFAISVTAIQAQLTASDEVRRQNNFINESSNALRRVEALNSIERASVAWAVAKLMSVMVPAVKDFTAAGNEKLTHSDEIIAACNEILAMSKEGEKLFTPEKTPEIWIMSEMFLGLALWEKGSQAEGTDAVTIMNNAIAAFKTILNEKRVGVRVYLREKSPEMWVTANNATAYILSDLSSRTEGAEGIAHIKNEITTLEATLSESEAGVKLCTSVRLPHEWEATKDALAMAYIDLGRRTEGPESVTQLKNAVAVYKSILEANTGGVKVYTPEKYPKEWRNAHRSLGYALMELSQRAEGADGLRYLNDGIAESRVVLEANDAGKIIFTPEKFPREWVQVQLLLGASLYESGRRMEGPEGVKRLKDAVDSYKAILAAGGAAGRIYTPEKFPQDWVLAQLTLAKVLAEYGSRVREPESLTSLNDSIAAARAIMEASSTGVKVYTPEKYPKEWLMAQNLLSLSLISLSARTQEPESRVHLSNAIAAGNEALNASKSGVSIYTPEKFPGEWAGIQNAIANASLEMGRRTQGPEGIRYLNDAITACRKVLKANKDGAELITPERFAETWGATQSILAGSLMAMSHRTEWPESLTHLKEAVAAYRAIPEATVKGVEVYNPTRFPQAWGTNQNALAGALVELSRWTQGDESLTHLKNAVANYDAVLNAFPPERNPMGWAQTQYWQGSALIELSRRAEQGEALSHINKAVAGYRAILTLRIAGALFCTPEISPSEWAMAQNALAGALSEMSRRTEVPESAKPLNEAVEASKAVLTVSVAGVKVYTPERFPSEWAGAQLNLATSLLDSARQATGVDRLTNLKDAMAAADEVLSASSGGVKIYPPESASQEWVSAQLVLASGYYLLNKWTEARDTYTGVLRLFPDAQDAYQGLSSLYHEETFEFDKAFALQEQWLARHKDDLNTQVEFAESNFTTSRFSQCNQRIDSLLAIRDVPVNTKAALRAIEIASLFALDREEQVSGKLNALIDEVKQQPAAFKVKGSWRFDGTKYFITHHEKLKSYRAWLNRLFDAFESTDRDSFLKALREAQARFIRGELTRARTMIKPSLHNSKSHVGLEGLTTMNADGGMSSARG